MGLFAEWFLWVHQQPWGGVRFITPVLALNLAATGWKSFQDQLEAFRIDALKQLNDAVQATEIDQNAERFQDCVTLADQELQMLCDRNHRRWTNTRRACTWCAVVLIIGQYFEVNSPFFMITALPIPFYAFWKYQAVRRSKKKIRAELNVLKKLEHSPKAGNSGIDGAIAKLNS